MTAGDDARLLDRLRSGDESAFEELVERYHMAMTRIARIYASDPRVAEEVVQETWIAVLRGLDRFEGRSSLKTWLFSILVNRARTYAVKEGRYVQQESLDELAAEPAIDSDRFSPPGVWTSGAEPQSWDGIPEARLESAETRAIIQQAIDALPDQQREAITLRDIEGLPSEEVCNILQVSETNQRVLLHRARTRVRRALEHYLSGTG
jgi:RNA polymerase sigma-70 factor (ECF subfamily)